MNLKIFLDTAEVDLIKKIDFTEIHGITTNPSLASKAIQNLDKKQISGEEKFEIYLSILKNISSAIKGDISGEVVSTNYNQMLIEAKKLASTADNIVVKLPITRDGLRLCKILSEDGIKTNMTLCFSVAQATLCALNGAKYVSPFIGRLDDLGLNGIELIRDIKKVFTNYDFKTQILAASIRNINHVLDCLSIGADALTLPPSLLNSLYNHPLTDKALDIFTKDWQS
jgi:transaldolase